MRFFLGGPRFFGIRPGIIFGLRDVRRFFSRPAPGAVTPMTGSFVYVFKGEHNLVKIGVSTNPDARLAQLRTASPFPIDYAYVGVTPGNGYDIEAEAHAILQNRRCNGEWFDVPPDAAVAAIAAASHRIRQPIQELKPWMVAETIRRCTALSEPAPMARPLRAGLTALQIFLGGVFGLFMAGSFALFVWFLVILSHQHDHDTARADTAISARASD